MKSIREIKNKWWLISILFLLAFFAINQIVYLTRTQFVCEQKIRNNQDLNYYEIASALQTHTNLWLFGWLVEPNTAEMCFRKQFHLYSSRHVFPVILEDDVVRKVKQSLINNESERLTWKTYNSRASIFLNGSTITRLDIPDDFENGTHDFGYTMWQYDISCDYKPGLIKIGIMPLSETVFDYLEGKNILAVYTDHRTQLEGVNKSAIIRWLENNKF